MIYITDKPETTAFFLPKGAQWMPTPASHLGLRDTEYWRWFGTHGKSAWRCELPGNADTPEWPERRILLIDRASSSQFDQALEALNAGIDLPDGLILLALEGSRFRGQRGRSWTALRGNLHFTAHYRIDRPSLESGAGLTLAPVAATARAVEVATEGRARPSIKWVNDVFLNGAKIAGVLTATRMQGPTIQNAVFGIGVNVAQAPAIEPTPFVPRAGSLAPYGITLPCLFHHVARALDNAVFELRTQGSQTLFEAYLKRALFIGRNVRIWSEESGTGSTSRPLAEGRVLAMNRDLSLVIEGQPEPVRNGRMELCPGTPN